MISWFIAALLASAAPSTGLTIHPGETIVFRVEDGHPVAVRNGGEPNPGELAAKLGVEEGRTLLQMTNNTAQALNYRATMTLPGGRTVRTSVCTLLSNNGGGFEFWPQRLEAVTIDNFKPAPERMSCR